MGYFDKIIGSLFPQKDNNGSRVLLKEVLNRKAKFSSDYNTWVNNGSADKMLQKVAEAYYLKKANLESDWNVHLLDSVYANGFAVTFNPNYTAREFEFLFDYLKNKVLELNYKLANSDRQVKEKTNYIESIDKHYLKPDIRIVEGELCDQLYGNVLLEYVSIDEMPSYLKVQVSIYSDSFYTKALSFGDFLKHVFGR